MKLSDIKGERALDIMADAMELADALIADERFADFAKALSESHGDRKALFSVLLKNLPQFIRDERYRERIISILAAANGVSYEEYAENGNTVEDIVGLLLSDSEAIRFFGYTAAAVD